MKCLLVLNANFMRVCLTNKSTRMTEINLWRASYIIYITMPVQMYSITNFNRKKIRQNTFFFARSRNIWINNICIIKKKSFFINGPIFRHYKMQVYLYEMYVLKYNVEYSNTLIEPHKYRILSNCLLENFYYNNVSYKNPIIHKRYYLHNALKIWIWW